MVDALHLCDNLREAFPQPLEACKDRHRFKDQYGRIQHDRYGDFP